MDKKLTHLWNRHREKKTNNPNQTNQTLLQRLVGEKCLMGGQHHVWHGYQQREQRIPLRTCSAVRGVP